MLIRRGGVTKDVSEIKFQQVFKARGYVKVEAPQPIVETSEEITPEIPVETTDITPDFDKMSYQELRKYAKDNDIDISESKKMVDILAKVKGA